MKILAAGLFVAAIWLIIHVFITGLPSMEPLFMYEKLTSYLIFGPGAGLPGAYFYTT